MKWFLQVYKRTKMAVTTIKIYALAEGSVNNIPDAPLSDHLQTDLLSPATCRVDSVTAVPIIFVAVHVYLPASYGIA